MGSVTDIVKSLVPASYRAMVGTTNSYYDQTILQGAADYVKFKLFSTAVPSYAFVDEAAEASTYDPVLLRFIGKLTTLQFIPAAIDYWGDQLVSESTQQPAEQVSYQRADLWKLYDLLHSQIEEEFDELAPIYGFKIYNVHGMIPRVSYGDNGRKVLLTPDPQDWPAIDSCGVGAYTLPWVLETNDGQ